jgi:transcriptional regulator of nitric oxide reductase
MQQIVKARRKISTYVIYRVRMCVKGAKMTLDLHLQLPDEYVEALRQHAAASGECVDAYVSQLSAEHLQPDVASARPANASSRDFGAWLRSWALQHPQLQHVVDDRRDSIYAGCGE